MELGRLLVGTLSEEADGLLPAVFDHLECGGLQARDDAAAAIGDGYAEMRQVGFGAEDSLGLLRVGRDERRHQYQGDDPRPPRLAVGATPRWRPPVKSPTKPSGSAGGLRRATGPEASMRVAADLVHL